MLHTIWLSYDLGVRGDYEGIYAWLDQHQAIECGDSLALLKYQTTHNDFLTTLKSDLEAAIETNKKTRIYVIWRDDETQTMKGRFLFGHRKSPAWTGYAESIDSIKDDVV